MPAANPIESLRVLLVDEFSVMRNIVRGSLREQGCVNFLEVSNGAQALETLENETVDLVVADWHIPEIEGIELLKTIRKDKRFKQLPFIVLASRADSEKIPSVLKTTRATYVTKPFVPEELIEKVKKVTKKRRKTTKSAASSTTRKSTTKSAASKKTTKPKAKSKKAAPSTSKSKAKKKTTSKSGAAKKTRKKKSSK